MNGCAIFPPPIQKSKFYKRISGVEEMRVVAWITDDAVEFICNFSNAMRKGNNRGPKVLEFGVGASTLFFASRSSSVLGFEHDIMWANKTKAHAELENYSHVEIQRLDRPYSADVERVVGAKKFDIISIDGRDRVKCLEEVLRLDLLATDGILVLDNMERISGEDRRYAPMMGSISTDYHHIHFEQLGLDRSGWSPSHRWLTTIAWRKTDKAFTSKGFPV